MTAAYQLTSRNIVIRASDGANIPMVVGNPDYEGFQFWIAEGNTPDPVAPPTPAEINAPILVQLAALDAKRARPLSDIALGNGDVKDKFGKTPRQRLAEIEADAEILRSKLAV